MSAAAVESARPADERQGEAGPSYRQRQPNTQHASSRPADGGEQQQTSRAGSTGTAHSHPPQQQQQHQAAANGRQAAAPQMTVDLCNSDDDEVQITQVRPSKRPRQALRSPQQQQQQQHHRPQHQGGAAGGSSIPLAYQQQQARTHVSPLKAAVPPPPPVEPPSPEGIKCAVCLDKIEEFASTACGHVYCYTCILAVAKEHGKCPKCRTKISKAKIHRLYLD